MEHLPGSVKGYDGWGHLTKIDLVLRHFPGVDWNYDWYSGSPFFLAGYPPLFYFAAAALVAVGVGVAAAMNALMVAIYLAMALSLYGLVRVATGGRLAGFAASLLSLASPVLWTHLVQGGLYPRVFGMGFVALSFMLAALYLRKPSRMRLLALVASVAGAVSSHVIFGAIALGAVFLVLLLVPDDAGRTRPSVDGVGRYRDQKLGPPGIVVRLPTRRRHRSARPGPRALVGDESALSH